MEKALSEDMARVCSGEFDIEMIMKLKVRDQGSFSFHDAGILL